MYVYIVCSTIFFAYFINKCFENKIKNKYNLKYYKNKWKIINHQKDHLIDHANM